MQIRYKENRGSYRLPSVRCRCDLPATFYQSSKDNANHGCYFFGCPNWRKTTNCKFFSWAHTYTSVCELNTLPQLKSLTQPRSTSPPVSKTPEELQRLFECAICQFEPRSHLIKPCNHLCLCEICAREIRDHCPICRQRIQLIERVFMV